jgi:high-affinity Fe2+/Pb2+ permease
LKSEVGRQAMRMRGEIVERSFAHVLDRGGMRQAWLRGRENNLGILMRALFGYGTPREAASARSALLFVIQIEIALAIVMIADIDGELAMLVIIVAPDTD